MTGAADGRERVLTARARSPPPRAAIVCQTGAATTAGGRPVSRHSIHPASPVGSLGLLRAPAMRGFG